MSPHYVILGSGVAGISAAEAIRSTGDNGQITLISDDPHGYYSRPGLAYYLTGEITRQFLFPWQTSEFGRLDLRIMAASVASLDPAAHTLALTDGRTVAYDRLLLATGSQAVQPALPGMDLPQVVKLDNMEDADGIIRMARKAKAAVVVGGGITALEIVEGLRAHCRRVHYLLRGARYWSNVLDEVESHAVLHHLARQGIEIHTGVEIASVEEKRGRVAGILTTDGARIPCDLVAVAIGVAPRADLARAAGLRVDRGVLVDETLRTSAADIFAAGDVAQVFDPRTGVSLLDTLWNIARSQGTVAGQNMAGGRIAYHKPVPFNVTRLAGLTTTIIGSVGRGQDPDLVGIARGDSEAWRRLDTALVAEDSFEVNRLRLLVGANTLVGAVVMGDQRPSRPLQKLISQQVDISPIRARLLEPGAPLADLLIDFADRCP